MYTSSTSGDARNCYYPNEVVISDKSSMKNAVVFDHVCSNFKDHRRSIDNFIQADVIVMDCDNDHSDDENDWISPNNLAEIFPDVPFIAVYSRNHMKPKGNKTTRPRFHVYFHTGTITDPIEYTNLKKEILEHCPLFDKNASDAARFIFGVENPEIEVYEGMTSIDDFLLEKSFEDWDSEVERNKHIIKEGSRNNTLYKYAVCYLKRFGNNDKSYSKFREKNDLCEPPLGEEELDEIWRSALKFYKKLSSQEGYIPPEEYGNKENNSSLTLMPTDYSDVGQANVMIQEYGEKIRHSQATGYIFYNESYWQEKEAESIVQGLVHKLTDRQLEEAEINISYINEEINERGINEKLGQKQSLDKEELALVNLLEETQYYKKFVLQRRHSGRISATLKEMQPMVTIDSDLLDSNPFLINTPSGTYNLETNELKPHKFNDFITKQTNVDISNSGLDLWENAVNTFFQNDKELIDYVQEVVGMASIGKIYIEALLIAYGEGNNGKSTFFNTIAKVLGSYSGNISADALTTGCRRNVKPELAELKGKRLVIAAELEEGMRLSTSILKQLCSTDKITAEKKFKAPFSFTPTHNLVLYTNHLPKVGALDSGTWRRLIVIPFNAKISGDSDIKDYSTYLFENAGGTILKWIIEGAKRFINNNFKLKTPKVVADAIATYREANNWLAHFLDECCEVDPSFEAKSGEVYTRYRNYCCQSGEYARGTADFYSALYSIGITKHKTNKGSIIKGLKLKSEFDD